MNTVTITDRDGDEVEFRQVEVDEGMVLTVSVNGGASAYIAEGDADTVRKALADTFGGSSAPAGPFETANEALLSVASAHGLTAEFAYSKGTGEFIENRRLVPEGFVTSKSGAVSVFGDDPDRDETRMYRLDRIKGQVKV